MVVITQINPIPGRTDFIKFVVLNDGKIHRGWQGNEKDVELYFDDEYDAISIGLALVEVERINDEFMNDGFEQTKNY
jgi:hypothetical protein